MRVVIFDGLARRYCASLDEALGKDATFGAEVVSLVGGTTLAKRTAHGWELEAEATRIAREAMPANLRGPKGAYYGRVTTADKPCSTKK